MMLGEHYDLYPFTESLFMDKKEVVITLMTD